jgi:hypothetical protein
MKQTTMKRPKYEPPAVDIAAYRFEKKWSFEVMMYGFTQIPNLLVCCQGHLAITDGEMITLISLL